ncbi:Fis family transcriptional regulator [Thermaerobacter sp. FW80]|uniref:SCP2 sterol-binding domain-containing protein n=1 Tax=Thermaerobacter sp. FW80 TaxID=2546351 RepID=UPI0010750899|nr:SCP2 sterol-binding domain-containing protein [Thermaerobacter sp. FW80]QBS38210.1 Fis family transcriptional regulator [Thermaerobacter sp. FW80]
MAYQAFTEEWAKAYKERINANANYREAARTWEWPLAFVLEADPSLGIEEERAIILDLYKGECRDARVGTKADLENVPYVISADAYTWKQVMDGELDPLAAMMRGKLKILKGDMGVLSGYVIAAKELVNSAQQVETEFPEGVA